MVRGRCPAWAGPQVLYKMDKAGSGDEICAADLPRNRKLSFVGFTPQMFLEVCASLDSARLLAAAHHL